MSDNFLIFDVMMKVLQQPDDNQGGKIAAAVALSASSLIEKPEEREMAQS
jgi:hypothetical protein